MDRLLGTDVEVHLKTNDIIQGTLFDIEEAYVYIQRTVTNFVTIPKENIKYFVSNSSQSTATTVDRGSNVSAQGRVVYESVQQAKQDISAEKSIEVFVDEEYLISIPVIPTLDISVFSDAIMRIVLSNSDVQMVLASRVQKAVEYVPGKVMFITSSDDEGTTPVFNEPSPQPPTSPNSFAMGATGGGDPAASFMNPSQMVTRLNKVTQERKK